MTFEVGKTYFLLGQNGSGKSSLALTLMGHPRYEVRSGTMTLEGQDLISMTPDERSRN